MKFRKKPVEIEAWRNTEGSEIPYWLQGHGTGNAGSTIFIPTLGGMKRVDPGVVRNDKGMLCPCKPDVFEEIYEPVVELDVARQASGILKVGTIA